jgi:NAD(P)H-dependent FMN reductase
MSIPKVLAVCGSLQAKSENLVLLETAAKAAGGDLEVVLFDGIRDLPLFNPDLESAPSPAVIAWRQALSEADAVLIATPEYGHSLPGSLKNAIDWAIGSGEFYHKVIAITASVKDEARGRQGLAALSQTLRAVDAQIAWEAPILQSAAMEYSLGRMLQSLAIRIRLGK